jgi:hypothetical protein
MCLSITIYIYMKEGRPSVGYGSFVMHELSSGISIWLAERMRLLTGREREREMLSQTDSPVKSLLSPQSVCAWPWE